MNFARTKTIQVLKTKVVVWNKYKNLQVLKT